MIREDRDHALPGTGAVTSLVAPLDNELREAYGASASLCPSPNPDLTLVLSQDRTIDLIELERLLEAVGWAQRPLRRVRRALDHSVMVVGLWRHHPRLPKLIGFARCTGDGVIEATIWDVAIHPSYQGEGLGKTLMDYVLAELRRREVERVSLFADPGVVEFYSRQGWDLEPLHHRCAFWYTT